MWDMMVAAAHSTALQWAVVAGAVLALVYKTLRSSEAPLMGDMYPDDLDS